MASGPSLSGRCVGLLEARRQRELADLVGRLGGTPVCAPALREAPVDGDAAGLVTSIVAGRFDAVVVLTATAFNALGDAALKFGLQPDLVYALGRMAIVCRGPKPLLALRRHQLQAAVVSPAPHTSDDLLRVLPDHVVQGRSVLLLHYGARNDAIGAALTARGARVTDACLYEWRLPDDVAPIQALVRLALGGRVDALLFTSQVQCRHLLQVASDMRLADTLVDVLRRDVVVGAIGPACASALRGAGIVPDVMPDMPNSPSLVRALADYFSLCQPAPEVSE